MSTNVQLECVVLDCPDPWRLACFYADLLGWEMAQESTPDGDWVTLLNPNGGTEIAFQRDPDFRAPTWPSNERPQMLHLDFAVPDIESEHRRALDLGARLLDNSPASFRVYADPAGHPFCLCASLGERGEMA